MAGKIICCFPSNREDIALKDKTAEYKEEIPQNESQTQSKGNHESSRNNASAKDKSEIPKVKSLTVKKSSNDDPNSQNALIKDPLSEYINSSREITKEEVENSPIVLMDEEGNGNLLNKTQIKINASGMIGGRNANDGVAIFGKPNSSNNTSSNFKADFELNYNEDLPYPYYFAIYFQRETKEYYIRAFSGKSSDNRILFIKLKGNYTLPVRQKEIISAGNVIFQVSPIGENLLEIVNLSKKEQSSNPKQTFNPNEVKEVTIGRDEKCNFSFPKDKSFSRQQTTFVYNAEDSVWVIVDGSQKKSSTNGTWVFGTHSFVIKDQMVVEILTTKVKFTLIQNEK